MTGKPSRPVRRGADGKVPEWATRWPPTLLCRILDQIAGRTCVRTWQDLRNVRTHTDDQDCLSAEVTLLPIPAISTATISGRLFGYGLAASRPSLPQTDSHLDPQPGISLEGVFPF